MKEVNIEEAEYVLSELEKDYDKMVEICMINMWGMNSRAHNIALTNFNPKDEGHLCILEIAGIAGSIFNFIPLVEINPFNAIKIRRNSKITFKRIKKKQKKTLIAIDTEDFLDYMENANEKLGIFEEIYGCYYKKTSKKKRGK